MNNAIVVVWFASAIADKNFKDFGICLQ